jgi:hypothetical protein
MGKLGSRVGFSCLLLLATSGAWSVARRGETGLAAAVPGSASVERCPEALVDVTAESSDQRHLACSAAKDALRLLGRCGISVRRAVHVHVVSEVRHPFNGVVFGLFDPRQERVLVTKEANIPPLVEGTPYSELPLRELYKSLIVHEVIHGVMHQNFKRQPMSYAAHEYPAYALQVDSFPSAVREKFLQSIPNRADPDHRVLNDMILFADPFFFAVHAYEHFKASGNGCTHLTALLQGDVAFMTAPQPDAHVLAAPVTKSN